MLETVKADFDKLLTEMGIASDSNRADAHRLADVVVSKGLADARTPVEIARFVRGHYPHLFGAIPGSPIAEAKGIPPGVNPREAGKKNAGKTATSTLPVAKDDNKIKDEKPTTPNSAPQAPAPQPPVTAAPTAPAAAPATK